MSPLENLTRPLCLIVMVLFFVAGRLQGQEGTSSSSIDVSVSDLSLHPRDFDGHLVSVQAVLVFGWEGDNFLLDPSKPSPVSMPSRDPASVWFYCKPERERDVYGPITYRRVVYGSFTGYFHLVPKTHIINGVFERGPLQFEAIRISIPGSQRRSLAEATVLGDVNETRRILQSSEKANIRHEYGSILLFHAVEAGRADFVQELLTGGADPKFAAPGGDTSLMKAAWNCNLEVARALLDHGASVNSANVQGETALIFASQTCQDGKMVQLLLNAGADPNAKTPDGITSLMAAAGNPLDAGELLKAGADPSAKDESGETVESESCDRGAEGFYRVCQLVRKALGKSACKPGTCN